MESKKCADLVQKHLDGRLEDLRKLYGGEGELGEYGLSIDYVGDARVFGEAGTLEKQRAGYLRYQLSWGGPSDEFRIFDNGKVEYWYMNWYDGASLPVEGKDAAMIIKICEPMKLKYVTI